MILVTGATGLVGSLLTLELLQKGYDVIATHRATSNIEKLKTIFSYYVDSEQAIKYFNQLQWREVDLLNAYDIYQALEGIDTVFHTAAIVSFTAKDKKEILINNVEGTKNIVNAALERNVKKFIHVSSVASLGENPGGIITEDTQAIPEQKISTYSKSKYYSELEVWRAQQEGLNTIIVNPSIILGPLPDWKRKVIGKMLYIIWEGLPFYINGRTGFVDVRDVVRAMIMLSEKETFGQRFIINAENLTIKQVLDMVADAMGRPRPKYLITENWIKTVFWLDQVRSRLTFTDPLLTKEYIKYINIDQQFSSEKLLKTLPEFHYTPIKETINFAVEKFINSLTEKEQKKTNYLNKLFP